MLNGACDAARTAEYWINVTNKMCEYESRYNPDVYSPMDTNFYNDAWNSVAFRFTSGYGKIEAVGGFAYHDTVVDRNGSQRLAEVVLYDKRLTDEELAAGQAYLRIKWGLDNFQRSMTNHVSVALAANAALDLGGADQYFECVSGAGVVSNGTLVVSKLVADPLVGPLALDGTLKLDAPPVVELRNLSHASDRLVPVVACGAVEGAENLRSAAFVGEVPEAHTPRLIYRDGILYATIKPVGAVLFVR